MSEKRIVTIGCELASSDVKHVSFRSKSSLLDFDIVLFRPLISDFLGYGTDYFQGKPSLSDTQSFQLRECCEHWRRELKRGCSRWKDHPRLSPRAYVRIHRHRPKNLFRHRKKSEDNASRRGIQQLQLDSCRSKASSSERRGNEVGVDCGATACRVLERVP